jgi:2-keto-4-pentenoate hydratase
VLGDPRVALAWLANEVSRHGVALAAGQVVTTGTCMAPLEILPGDKVTADFGALGTVGVRFRP